MENLHLVNMNGTLDQQYDYLDNITWSSLIFIHLIIFLILQLFIYKQAIYKNQRRINAKNVLLFTAHPDDEVMFFGPTILNMLRERINLYLICLSVGNYEGKGSERIDELYNCTRQLGLDDKNVIVIKDDRLKDGQKEIWPIDHLSSLLIDYIDIYEPDTILTFDSLGVSSHSNHISLYKALIYLKRTHRLPSNSSIYFLYTVNIFRKYISYFDLSYTLLHRNYLYTINLSDYFILIKAMSLHKSQFIWFRKLYVIFSRYMFINSYRKVT